MRFPGMLATMSEAAIDGKRAIVMGAPDKAADPGVLGVREAASYLGVSERTVRRAMQRGELPAAKRGRHAIITIEALDRYLVQRRSISSRSARPPLALVPKPAPPAVVPFPARRPRLATLPAPLTRFFGRESEVAAVSAILRRDDVRLVTLTGPGGVGKTRLGLKVTAELAPDFAGGAAFVPLAPVSDPDLVPTAIALALEMRDGEDKPPAERLRRFLRDREMLLLLDNFEQVTEAGPFLAELLVSCPGLTVLVTSRAALHLSGERVFAVPPLALPARLTGSHEEDALPPLSELAAVEAVRLFVDRAETAAGEFTLTADNAAAVVAICERADGLPLAIELAAARTALLSPDALLARLDPRLPLLSDGPRDQPDRLRTMHDAIAWSHDLLSPTEQACFRRLAVFVGGCTIDGAEYVGGGASLRGERGGEERSVPPFVLDLVQRLVDQAVLKREVDAAGVPRFGMLETIREYGLEQLAASGEETAIRDAHAAWCVDLAERAEPELMGPDQGVWVRALEAELGNIRAAHDWLADREETESALRLAGAIGWFWSSAPYLEEARVRFDAVLALPDVERFPAALAKVLHSAGDIADWQGDQRRARDHFERALAIHRARDDRWRMVSMLRGLGSSAIDRGELDLALSLLEESLALAREVGNEWEAAAATNLIGTAVAVRGDFSGALARHEEAAAGWRALGDTGHVITALASAAWVALLAREPGRAAAAYGEALALAVAGDDAWYTTWCVIGAGGLAAARGDSRLAAHLLASGMEHRDRLGVPLRPHVAAELDRMIESVRTRLGDREFAALWETGRTTPIAVAASQAVAVFEAARPDEPAPYDLTRRERDVLRLMADGLADKEIANALFVARATASKHVAAILSKLGVDSRTAAVAIALRHELV